MMARSCRSVRRLLSAFHDGELPVGEQIAVQAHLRQCRSCAAEARELALLGSMVRDGSPVAAAEADVLAGLAAGVVSRVKAEREQSITGWGERVFEDLHVFWAALGATGATVACVAIIFGIFFYATQFRPDSLGGLIALQSLPAGSNENPLNPDNRVVLPTASEGAFAEAALPNEDESVFALAAVLTREGTIAYLELLHAEAVQGNVRSRQEEQAIMAQLAKAKFEPARYGGAPVAVNMVWLYTQLTVRGKIVPDDTRPPARSISSLQTVDAVAAT